MEIPGNEYKDSDLVAWYNAQKELEALKKVEMLLRKKIAKHFFTNPKEGVNNVVLPDGYVLKMEHKISRTIDIGAFHALQEEMRKVGINPEALVEYKPSLLLREYRTLTAEQQAHFDQCLEVSVNSPALHIVPGKVKGDG